jgi:hypothetical protein
MMTSTDCRCCVEFLVPCSARVGVYTPFGKMKADSLKNLCAELSANSLDKNPALQILLSHISHAAHLEG